MSLPIYLISQMTLEEWKYTTPFETGIGGSETAHIECALRLAKRGYNVISYCPLPKGKYSRKFGKVTWQDVRKAKFPTEPAIIINYRHPKLFDRKKPKDQVWWFIAQDVDYEGQWSELAMKNVDRYMCLCKTHVDYTLAKYPLLRDKKVFLSTNGIRTDFIKDLPKRTREPYRMFWASSPDRGLALLLQNWFRIRERFPEATLRIAYGFDNMDTIIKWQGPQSPLIPLRDELKFLGDQKGVTWLGRLPQDKVFEEWQRASVNPYCSDWPETSFISIMESMACGAIPVTTNFWAQGEHATRAPLAYVSDGLPQKSELSRSIWLSNLFDALERSGRNEFDIPFFDASQKGAPGWADSQRKRLQDWARESYDWDRIIEHWRVWLDLDMRQKRKR